MPIKNDDQWNATHLPDLTGRTAVVTGANSGIGLTAADALARAGAHVVFAVRDLDRGRAAAATVNGSTEVRRLDLADLSSVRDFAQAWQGPLHLLLNNAGVMMAPRSLSPQGQESQFAANTEHGARRGASPRAACYRPIFGTHKAPGWPDDGWNGTLAAPLATSPPHPVFTNATHAGWSGAIGWAEVCPDSPHATLSP
jgi:NAD(P)-dependent dehydrogenase (short-subunit alcohol dehydrogenase family)